MESGGSLPSYTPSSDPPRPEPPAERREEAPMATMTLPVNHRYLWLPVRDGAEKRWVSLYEGHQPVDQFWAEVDASAPDGSYFLDLSEFAGRVLTLYVDGDVSLLDAFTLSDEMPEDLYREALRPRFHFTTRRGWINDPNGLFHLDGWYHLFYQHDPFSRRWGNMHWGHARTRDLVHWEELADAVRPDPLGTAFSGSAVVDRANASGLGDGKAPPSSCSTRRPAGRPRGTPRPGGRTASSPSASPAAPTRAGPSRSTRGTRCCPTSSKPTATPG